MFTLWILLLVYAGSVSTTAVFTQLHVNIFKYTYAFRCKLQSQRVKLRDLWLSVAIYAI